MASRKLGYKPDPPDARDLNLRSLQLSAAALPSKFSLRPHVRQVLDQGSTSSCVANAFSQAIVIAEEHRGVTVELPSRLYIYFNARRQHEGAILTDSGTYLRSAAMGLQKLGAPPESVWEFGSGMFRVNRRPSWDAFMRAHGRRGGGYWRIAEEGEARAQAIKTALVAGMPVAFGTKVARSFMEDGPEVVTIPKPGEPIAGGHAMTIVGYETTTLGTFFDVVNSWGESWRDGGFCRFTQDYVCWPFTSDLWCVRGWEVIRDVNV